MLAHPVPLECPVLSLLNKLRHPVFHAYLVTIVQLVRFTLISTHVLLVHTLTTSLLPQLHSVQHVQLAMLAQKQLIHLLT